MAVWMFWRISDVVAFGIVLVIALAMFFSAAARMVLLCLL